MVNILTIYKIAPITKEASVPSTQGPPVIKRDPDGSYHSTNNNMSDDRVFVTWVTFFSHITL